MLVKKQQKKIYLCTKYMGDKVTNGSVCPSNDYRNNTITLINIKLILQIHTNH